MKVTATTLLACGVLLFAACKKQDYCKEPPEAETKCNLAQSLISGFDDNPGQTSQYRKEYDPVTGKVRKVVAGRFTFYLTDSISLLVQYNGNTIHLIQEGSPTDTVLNAHFGSDGRLLNLTEGNAPVYDLPQLSFNYTAGRLSNISGEYELDITYDGYGNVVKMEDPSLGAQSFYHTYDVSVSATKQFYPDGFYGDSYNSLFLAQFMGWLPDLEPVSKRTFSRTVTGDYELYSSNLTNHVYDSEGKLISYKTFNVVTYTNVWNCNEKNSKNAN